MTRRAFIISTLVIVLSLIWEIVLAIDPVHTSRLLQDTGNDNSTDPDNPPPDEQHEHHPEGHDHSNYIYTASLMLVAVPTVVGLSAAAVLVKRSMTQHQSKGPAVSTDLEESKVDLADSEDDEEAKKSATSPSENTSGEKGDKPKNKSFWMPALSRGGTYARPKSFYVNIQREDSENFFELTLATPMEDNEDTPREHKDDKTKNDVYNLRI